MLLSPIYFKKKRYPNYVGAGSAAQHAAAGLILDLHAARATGTGPNSNSDTSKRGTWVDLSGNGYNGSLNGFGYTSLSGWAGNNVLVEPSRLIFDGVDDYVNCGDVLNFGSSDFTIEVWYLMPTAATVSLLGRWSGSAGYCIVIDATGKPLAFLGSSSCWRKAPALSANALYQLVLNKHGTVADWYINGVKSNGDTSGGSVPSSLAVNATNFIIGKGQYPNYPTGFFPILRAYNRSLTQSEITQNFNCGVTW